jgi:hypothetical protein
MEPICHRVNTIPSAIGDSHRLPFDHSLLRRCIDQDLVARWTITIVMHNDFHQYER